MAEEPAVICSECERILSRLPDVDFDDPNIDFETFVRGMLKTELKLNLDKLHKEAPWLPHD